MTETITIYLDDNEKYQFQDKINKQKRKMKLKLDVSKIIRFFISKYNKNPDETLKFIR